MKFLKSTTRWFRMFNSWLSRIQIRAEEDVDREAQWHDCHWLWLHYPEYVMWSNRRFFINLAVFNVVVLIFSVLFRILLGIIIEVAVTFGFFSGIALAAYIQVVCLGGMVYVVAVLLFDVFSPLLPETRKCFIHTQK